MKKKVLSALLSVAMAATMLVGCGNSEKATTETAPAEAATTEAATEAGATEATASESSADGYELALVTD